MGEKKMFTAPPAYDNMRAIVRDRYGSPDVLELKDIAKPPVDADGVLVRVRAASVNAADWHLLRGRPFLVRMLTGLRKPKSTAVGVDLAGIVEAVGRNVTEFRPGDEVLGHGSGAFAEYVCTGENNIVLKPANLTFEQAAAVPMAGSTALQALHTGRIQPGQKVLINGAAGGVGTFAVQIAKSLGAEVTGVCSTRNVDMVRSIGADHVVDYTKEDFTRSGLRYDVMVDMAGNHSLSACRRVLRAEGVLVSVGSAGGPEQQPSSVATLVGLLGTLIASRFTRQRLLPFLAKFRKEDLVALKKLIEAGKVTPVVDTRYPLSAVPAALRHLETGHARGKVVITFSAN
jgi:NADPH:quinone reductase-like Zn-dependent oxidoreductase